MGAWSCLHEFSPKILSANVVSVSKILPDAEMSTTRNENVSMAAMEAKPDGHPIVNLTTSDFDRYIGGDQLVFVDFWAVWCPPCRAMEPVVEKLAAKYSGRVVFGMVNTDEEPEIATRYDVMSIPTFMVFKNGQPREASVGAVGEAALDRLIQKSIGASTFGR